MIPSGKKLRTHIMHEMHDVVASGHGGRDVTLARVKQRFYWGGMDREVAMYVKGCALCQRNKPSHERTQSMPQPLEIPARPYQQISMDFIMPLPVTKAGNDAILVVVDKLTKQVTYIPHRTTATAADVGNLLYQWVVRVHGVPESILSDRDVRFTSAYWATLWSKLGTSLAMGTAYHPQSDGQTERANRTLKEAIRGFVNHQQDNWDTLLPGLEMAMNSAKQASTGFTPFFMNHSREMRMPIDVVLPQGDSILHPGGAAQAKLVQEALVEAKANLGRAQD